jgi:hypothetical protein
MRTRSMRAARACWAMASSRGAGPKRRRVCRARSLEGEKEGSVLLVLMPAAVQVMRPLVLRYCSGDFAEM